MQANWISFATAFLGFSLAACTGPQPTVETGPAEPTAEEPPASVAADLGRVDIETTCDEQAQSLVEIGTAQLHHMWYEKARDSFQDAAAADPDCAMTYWGEAMTYYTPLWAKPEPQELEAGAQAAQKAVELGGESARERAFIDAVAAFYEDYQERDHAERAEAFRDGWEQAYERDEEDVEAASFYALSLLSTIPPMSEDIAKHEQAGAILEDVLEREPEHPGGHHYLIHAYDHPELAERAVSVARSYAEIAPAVPHALHMPSHIFIRLGMWDDSIEWNERSEEAAARNPIDGKSTLHLFHALDYETYAYLQQADDDAARQVAQRAEQADNPQQHVAVAYASVAIPARIALERRDWQAAADLEPLHPEQLDWQKWPYIDGITVATRAIGSIYLEDLRSARAELARLDELLEASAELDEPYWTTQLEIFGQVADALLTNAEGRPTEAIDQMRAATTRQDRLGKHPVTPGRVIQAREYLAELLRQNDQPEAALDVYEAALERTPGRFNAVYGAAVSAREAGEADVAREYYRQLLELASGTDSDRPALEEARQYTAIGGGEPGERESD